LEGREEGGVGLNRKYKRVWWGKVKEKGSIRILWPGGEKIKKCLGKGKASGGVGLRSRTYSCYRRNTIKGGDRYMGGKEEGLGFRKEKREKGKREVSWGGGGPQNLSVYISICKGKALADSRGQKRCNQYKERGE